MTPREIGSVLCAAAGLLVIALRLDEAILQIVLAITGARHGQGSPLDFLLVLVSFLPIILGILLIRFREEIAEHLFPAAPQRPSAVTLRSLHQALQFAVGLYLFAHGLALSASSFVRAFRTGESLFEDFFLYAYLAEVTVGLLLCLGSQGLSGTIALLRNQSQAEEQ
jgi:Na+-driven multidrug efflux pump